MLNTNFNYNPNTYNPCLIVFSSNEGKSPRSFIAYADKVYDLGVDANETILDCGYSFIGDSNSEFTVEGYRVNTVKKIKARMTLPHETPPMDADVFLEWMNQD